LIEHGLSLQQNSVGSDGFNAITANVCMKLACDENDVGLFEH